MAKVIIGIHGLSNKPEHELLEKWWEESILEGLKNSYRDDAPEINFELVYWADILYEKPLNIEITDKDSPFYLDEPYLKAKKRYRYIKYKKSYRFIDFVKEILGKFVLNKNLSIKYHYIADVILHRFFKDLEAYYKHEKEEVPGKPRPIKNIIRSRLVQVLEKHKKDEILLLAHSMGSIIAMDVLYLLLKDYKIHTLVTLGSPIGISVIKRKLAEGLNTGLPDIGTLATPEQVQAKWFNFFDVNDEVANDAHLIDDFGENTKGVKVIDQEVFNNYEVKGKKNPHKSFGYLRTNELAKVVYEFIYGEQTVLKKRISFKLFKFQIDIKIKTNKK